ncbi:MAG: NAD-dependent epimerase/dehydratase family protein [Ignavibacteriae bacterium]|nr:NAD-dependent epimerase/dehydratase family protein [Ignavibacteriota bacterium]
MKILVTGGAGFIASHITDAYINAGHDVFIIDNFSSGRKENVNHKATLIEMDINDEKVDELFKIEKFDIINHHAAQMDVRFSVDNPRFDATTNILGSLNLYESAKKYGVKKVIFASTGGAVYGEQDYFPADENHPTSPCSPYGIAKLANEKYLFYYKQIFGMEHVIFRYVNVYGPRQNPHGEAGVVAIFINKMLSGNQPVINGDGLNTRDYVFVEDVVKANLLALKSNVSGIYNNLKYY